MFWEGMYQLLLGVYIFCKSMCYCLFFGFERSVYFSLHEVICKLLFICGIYIYIYNIYIQVSHIRDIILPISK